MKVVLDLTTLGYGPDVTVPKGWRIKAILSYEQLSLDDYVLDRQGRVTRFPWEGKNKDMFVVLAPDDFVFIVPVEISPTVTRVIRNHQDGSVDIMWCRGGSRNED